MPAIRDNKLIDALRMIGDPDLESDAFTNDLEVCSLVLKAIGHVGLVGIDRGEMDRYPELTDEQKGAVQMAWRRTADVAWETTGIEVLNPADAPSVHDRVKKAQQLFSRDASEISAALLLAALPQTYATAWGARVLATEGGLRSDLRRRIRRTAQFLVYAMSPEPDPRSDPHREYFTKLPAEFRWSFEAAVSLRLFHHALRTHLKALAEPQPPKVDDFAFLTYLTTGHLPAPGEPTKEEASRAAGFRMQLGPRNIRDPEAAKERGEASKKRGRITLARDARGTPNRQSDPAEEKAPENVPLNQEDLLGTLLTFSITVFETLDRFGMPWTAEEQETYFTAWDVIGSWMGIGTASVVAAIPEEDDGLGLKRLVDDEPAVTHRNALRPATVLDARAWLTQLRDRQWQPVRVSRVGDHNLVQEWDSLQPGRLLLRALLEELDEIMPPMRGGWPLSVMRQLADDVVRDRLGLGGGGIIQAVLEALPKTTTMVDDFTSLRVRNRVGAHVLRFMANSVTQQTVIHFVEHGDPPFEFPTMFDEGTGSLPE